MVNRNTKYWFFTWEVNRSKIKWKLAVKEKLKAFLDRGADYVQFQEYFEKEKKLNLDEFFKRVNVPNKQLIQIKKSIIQLLNELVENKIIQNEIKVVLKSGRKKDQLIRKLTTSDITRRIKYLKFDEKIKNI